MPAVSATTVLVEEVKIDTRTRQKLMLGFREYQSLSEQIKALEAKKDAVKKKIADIREDQGVMTLTLNGFTTTMVAGTRKEFDEQLFVRNGGDLDVYNESIVLRPNKPYEKVTCPKPEKD